MRPGVTEVDAPANPHRVQAPVPRASIDSPEVPSEVRAPELEAPLTRQRLPSPVNPESEAAGPPEEERSEQEHASPAPGAEPRSEDSAITDAAEATSVDDEASDRNENHEPGGLRFAKTCGVLAILLLLTLLIRFEVVTEGVIPARGDTLTGFIPHKSHVARVVRDGQIPLWDPHIFAGQPFLADPQTAVFSPLSIPFYVLPLVPAFIVYIILKHFLAAAFTFGFLRSIGANRAGALFGGVVFSFSSTMFRQIPWQEVASTTVWVPLMFWMCELVIRNPRRLGVGLGLVAVFAFENLAGHPQLTYYHYLALGVYCGLRLLARMLAGRGFERSVASAAILLVTVGLGLGVSMIQVMPLREFQAATRYGEPFPLEEAANPMSSLVDLPNVFLGGVYPDYEDHINTSYLGVMATMLVPVGLLAGGAIAWIFGLLALAAVAIAVGLDTPVFPFLFETLPGWRYLHGPVRFLPVATFMLALLAGLGASGLFERVRPRGRRGGMPVGITMAALGILTGMAAANRVFGPFVELPFPIANGILFGAPALLVLLAFATGHIGRVAFATLALLVAFADSSHFVRARYPNVYGNPSEFLDPTETVRTLREDPELFRSIHFTNSFAVQKRIEIDESVIRTMVASIYPNFSLHHGTYDAQGVYTLKPERYTDFVREVNRGVKGGRWILDRLTMLGNPFSRLFDLLNVKYLLTAERNPLPATSPLVVTRDGDALRATLANTSQSNGVFLDWHHAPGASLPETIDVRIERRDGDPVEASISPTWIEMPAFAGFRAYEAEPAAIERETVLRLDGSGLPEDAGWQTVGEGAVVELVDGRLRLDGDEPRQILSPIVDFDHHLAVRFTATPTATDAGVTITLREAATDDVLYRCVYGDERFTGLMVGERGVKATRAIRTEAGRTDTGEFVFEQDRFRFLFGEGGERTLFRYRDLAATPPERVRLEIGVRGGAIDFDAIEVLVPRAEDRLVSRRAMITLPRGSVPTSVSATLPDRAALDRITLLDTAKFTHVLDSDGVSMYRNERSLPRAFLVGGYRVLDSDEALLEAIGSRDFDPTTTLLFTEDPGFERPEGPYTLTESTTEITSYEPNRVVCKTRCPEAAFLWMSDMLFDGWYATVDGERAPIHEANHCFRAVAVPAGEHEVVFTYAPRSFRLGALLSGASIALALILFALARRWSRASTASPLRSS